MHIATYPARGLILTLRSSASCIRAGENVEFRETLENASDVVIWQNFRDFRRSATELASYPPNYHLSTPRGSSGREPFVRNSPPIGVIFDADEAPNFPQAVMTSRHFATRLEPGKQIVMTYRFRILRPGIYRMSSEWTAAYAANRRAELWKGTITSNPVDLTVLPR